MGRGGGEPGVHAQDTGVSHSTGSFFLEMSEPGGHGKHGVWFVLEAP